MHFFVGLVRNEVKIIRIYKNVINIECMYKMHVCFVGQKDFVAISDD